MEASVVNCTGTCTLPGKLITFQGKTFYCNSLISHDGVVQEQVATLIPE